MTIGIELVTFFRKGGVLSTNDGDGNWMAIEEAINAVDQEIDDKIADGNFATVQSVEDLGTEVEMALAGKVDKVTGKGLSANDFTDELKAKLEGLDPGGEGLSIIFDNAGASETLQVPDDIVEGQRMLINNVTARVDHVLDLRGAKVRGQTLSPSGMLIIDRAGFSFGLIYIDSTYGYQIY